MTIPDDLKRAFDEAAQILTFNVSNDNNPLFSVQPAVAANGTLTYTPAADTIGTATVTVELQDNGGTANGGVDTSAQQTFTITVNPPGNVDPVADSHFLVAGQEAIVES